MSAGVWALFLAVFLACAVEAVEATTIVLAAGTARDWRSAATGTGAALAALAVIVAVAGPAVSAIPLHGLRLVIGALLLIFGLQWLRKGILRASGHKALHDENRLYAEHLAQAEAGRPGGRLALVPDWYGFTLAFKGVLLEGLEVVFIVLTFGSNARDIPVAVIAAAVAVLLVAAVGVAVRAPLARVPENTLKLITLYRWLALKFPGSFTDQDYVNRLRRDATEQSLAILRRNWGKYGFERIECKDCGRALLPSSPYRTCRECYKA